MRPTRLREPEPDKRLDQYPLALQINEDGTLVLGSSDTDTLLEAMTKLEALGVEVTFEGVLMGLPWCG